MEAVREERELDVQAIVHEVYEDADDEEVMKMSDYLLEKHREAYIALANA